MGKKAGKKKKKKGSRTGGGEYDTASAATTGANITSVLRDSTVKDTDVKSNEAIASKISRLVAGGHSELPHLSDLHLLAALQVAFAEVEEMMTYLVDVDGVDVNAKDTMPGPTGGVSALNVAVQNCAHDSVRVLLSLGADPNLPKNNGATPVLTCIFGAAKYSGFGRFQCLGAYLLQLDTLLKYGGTTKPVPCGMMHPQQSPDGSAWSTPKSAVLCPIIMCVSQHFRHADYAKPVLEVLLGLTEDIDTSAISFTGLDALQTAAHFGHTGCAELLVLSGWDPTKRGGYRSGGKTLLEGTAGKTAAEIARAAKHFATADAISSAVEAMKIFASRSNEAAHRAGQLSAANAQQRAAATTAAAAAARGAKTIFEKGDRVRIVGVKTAARGEAADDGGSLRRRLPNGLQKPSAEHEGRCGFVAIILDLPRLSIRKYSVKLDPVGDEDDYPGTMVTTDGENLIAEGYDSGFDPSLGFIEYGHGKANMPTQKSYTSDWQSQVVALNMRGEVIGARGAWVLLDDYRGVRKAAAAAAAAKQAEAGTSSSSKKHEMPKTMRLAYRSFDRGMELMTVSGGGGRLAAIYFVDALRQRPGLAHADAFVAMNNLGNAYIKYQRYYEAMLLARRCTAILPQCVVGWFLLASSIGDWYGDLTLRKKHALDGMGGSSFTPLESDMLQKATDDRSVAREMLRYL